MTPRPTTVPMTELVDADIPRVDLVDKAANGRTWLLMKGEESTDPNLLTTDYVESLIKEAKAEMADKADEVVKDDPNLDAGGDPIEGSSDPLANTPGSAAWEQVDADTALRWVAILSRAKNAIALLAEREGIEAMSSTGDEDDIENAWDLEDTTYALDYVIGVLAGYAAGEQAEVDLESVGKAVAALVEAEPSLAVVEGVGPLAKAGRVLSAANEQKLRDAEALIKQVLAGLPTAEVEETPEVAKAEEPVLDLSDPVVEKAAEPVAPAAPAAPSRFSPEARAARVGRAETRKGDVIDAPAVAKADDESGDGGEGDTKLLAVFNADGDMIGVVDPADVQTVDGGKASAAEPDKPAEEPAPAAAPAPAAPAPAAKAAQQDPAESDAKLSLTKADLDALIDERVEAAKAEMRQEVEALRKPAPPAVAKRGHYTFPEDVEHRGQAGAAALTKSDDEVAALKYAAAHAATPEERQAATETLSKGVASLLASRIVPAPPRPPRR